MIIIFHYIKIFNIILKYPHYPVFPQILYGQHNIDKDINKNELLIILVVRFILKSYFYLILNNGLAAYYYRPFIVAL